MNAVSGGQIFVWELLGTAVLVGMGTGSVASVVLKGSLAERLGSGWVAIVLGWGFGLFTGLSVAAKSGAHLNPAVTLALAIDGRVPWSQVVFYVAGQFVGAFLGAFACFVAFKPLFDVSEDNSGAVGVFCSLPAVRRLGWNTATETIATFVLVLWLLTNPEINAGLGVASVAFVVIAIGFAFGASTGYAINPARDLGPRLAYAIMPIRGKGSADWGYAWVPIVGPLLGATLAALLVGGLT